MDEWVRRDRLRFLPELQVFARQASLTPSARAAADKVAELLARGGPGGVDRKDHTAPGYQAALSAPLPPNLQLACSIPLDPLTASAIASGTPGPSTVNVTPNMSETEFAAASMSWVRVEARDEALAASIETDHGPYSEHDIHEHNAMTKVKNIDEIVLGQYVMPTWYRAPFPVELVKSKTLWFCETCLSFFSFETELDRHRRRCTLKHPPGDEIYRSKETGVEICMFEVDGAREPIYCENLSYIAKLFLDHKDLQGDTTIFFFYVLCEISERGCIPVGYFSKVR